MGEADEIWKPVPGYDGYEASSLGRVRSTRSGEVAILAQRRHTKAKQKTKGPYYYVSAYVFTPRRIRKAVPVHKMVLLAFSGPKPTPHHQCRHLDGNPVNNHASNLAWGTPLENQRDQVRHGTAISLRLGEDHPACRLTAESVKVIRRLAALDVSTLVIAASFGISEAYARAIVLRRERMEVGDGEELSCHAAAS
jgi:hypothetical protein